MSKGLPIFIPGMHRSGTSLTANLLRQCGLWLGPENELIGATADNPDGHWENVVITEINDILLSELGGGWDDVPEFPADWIERFSAQRVRAVEMHASLADRTPWGWKDPRASLTMPFWLSLEPNARVVICVRHPLEVAHSLRQRGLMSYSLGLKLWRLYHQRLLADVPREQRIVVHYDHFFTEPVKTLQRLGHFCGLKMPDQEIAEIISTIKPQLRHARFDGADLVATHVANETVRVYAELCEEAGISEAPRAVARTAGVSGREVDLDALTYLMFLRQWRWLVERSTPEGARVAVISKGDNELLQVQNREAWHFPQDENGAYAGYYPADSEEAIEDLEAVRAKGAEYLLIPLQSLWWLDHYEGFRRHLESCWHQVQSSKWIGAIYAIEKAAQ